MKGWTFFGRVTPERVPISIGQAISGSAEAIGFGVTYEFSTFVHDSQIITNISNISSDIDLPTLKNIVQQSVRSLVDIICQQRGLSLDVEIVSASNRETGEVTVFGINIPVLANKKAGTPMALSADLLIAVGAEPGAQIALASFREAMRVAVDCGFFCYRSLDALMQTMKSKPNEGDARAWKALRESLLVDRSAIDLIKQHADAPRHGRVSFISDQDRAAILDITDQIIDRYLHFLLNKKVALDEKVYGELRAVNTPPTANT